MPGVHLKEGRGVVSCLFFVDFFYDDVRRFDNLFDKLEVAFVDSLVGFDGDHEIFEDDLLFFFGAFFALYDLDFARRDQVESLAFGTHGPVESDQRVLHGVLESLFPVFVPAGGRLAEVGFEVGIDLCEDLSFIQPFVA